jgi:hypothetical protein
MYEPLGAYCWSAITVWPNTMTALPSWRWPCSTHLMPDPEGSLGGHALRHDEPLLQQVLQLPPPQHMPLPHCQAPVALQVAASTSSIVRVCCLTAPQQPLFELTHAVREGPKATCLKSCCGRPVRTPVHCVRLHVAAAAVQQLPPVLLVLHPLLPPCQHDLKSHIQPQRHCFADTAGPACIAAGATAVKVTDMAAMCVSRPGQVDTLWSHLCAVCQQLGPACVSQLLEGSSDVQCMQPVGQALLEACVPTAATAVYAKHQQ